MPTYIIRQPRGIRIVERRVDLVEHEKRRRRVRVDGEEQGQRGHGLFAAGQVLHIAEALEGGHRVVFDA